MYFDFILYLQNIEYNCQLTEWENKDSKEHDDDVAPHIVTGVVEGYAAAILKCLKAPPANHRSYYKILS